MVDFIKAYNRIQEKRQKPKRQKNRQRNGFEGLLKRIDLTNQGLNLLKAYSFSFPKHKKKVEKEYIKLVKKLAREYPIEYMIAKEEGRVMKIVRPHLFNNIELPNKDRNRDGNDREINVINRDYDRPNFCGENI